MTLATYTAFTLVVGLVLGMIFQRGLSGEYSKARTAVLMFAIGAPIVIYDFFIQPSSTWIS